jgi:hypothetical protein
MQNPIYVWTRKELEPDAIKKKIEERGWTVQQTGENFDIYCSKRCAS